MGVEVSPEEMERIRAGLWPVWLLRKFLGVCRWVVILGCAVCIGLFDFHVLTVLYFLTMAALAAFVIRVSPVAEWQQRWHGLQAIHGRFARKSGSGPGRYR